MTSVPVQVGVELGSKVAGRVGAAVPEAVAVNETSPSLWEGVRKVGDGIAHATITTSPMTPTTIQGSRLRRGVVFASADLAFVFTI